MEFGEITEGGTACQPSAGCFRVNVRLRSRGSGLRNGPGQGPGTRKRPERPLARHRPKPVTTFGPSGLALRATCCSCLGFLPFPLSLGFGAFRASPPAELVGLPNPASRCAQSALRLSQGVPFGSLTQPLRLLGATRTLRRASTFVKVTKPLVATCLRRSAHMRKQCDKTRTWIRRRD